MKLKNQIFNISTNKEFEKTALQVFYYQAENNLVYKQYSITTEAEPYKLGTRIIEKLTIIEKINPDGLSKNTDIQKMN